MSEPVGCACLEDVDAVNVKIFFSCVGGHLGEGIGQNTDQTCDEQDVGHDHEDYHQWRSELRRNLVDVRFELIVRLTDTHIMHDIKSNIARSKEDLNKDPRHLRESKMVSGK